MSAVEFDNVSIVFGDKPATALPLMDDGLERPEIREKTDARRTYQQARDAGRVASLVEQQRANQFQTTLANIEAGAEIRVTISFLAQVDFSDGVYNLAIPMTFTPRWSAGDRGNVTADSIRDWLNPEAAGTVAPTGLGEVDEAFLSRCCAPVMDGIELLRRIKQDDPETEVIMITGHGDMELAIRSLKNEATDFITKPINVDTISQAINAGFEEYHKRA